MSRNKSRIGFSPATRQQPPPVIPGARWFTHPPIAKLQSGPDALDWLQLPSAHRSPDVAHVKQAVEMRTELRLRIASCGTKNGRRTLRRQLAHVESWLAAADAINRAHDLCREPRTVATLAPTPTMPTTSTKPSIARSVTPTPPPLAPADAYVAPPSGDKKPNADDPTRHAPMTQLKKRIAQLQVRIDVLTVQLRGQEAALADPATYRDAPRWNQLLSEFQAGQVKLDELRDRRDYAQAEVEALQEGRRSPAVERIEPPPTASAVRARLGRRVHELRMKRGLTQEALAHQAGIPSHLVPSIEIGDKSTSIEVLAAIAHALRTTLSELLLGVDVALPSEAKRLASMLAAQPVEAQRSTVGLVELALALVAR